MTVPVIPLSMCGNIINDVHQLGHTNVEATVKCLRKLCYFPWLWRTTYDIVSNCERCILNSKPEAVLPMRATVSSVSPWHTLHMDIVSYESVHMLTVIDSFSKYLVWEWLSTMSSGSVANALQKCFVKLGPPNQIVADNARNLQGPEVLRLLESFKVKLTHSSEYYPKGNAVCERVHRTLHKLARTYGLNSPELLRREFQKLVHVYNSRPHKALSYRCPYEVLFGRNPSFSEHGQRQYDLRDLYEIWDDVRLHQAQQFRNNKLGYDRRHNVKQRMSGDYAPGQDVLLYQRRIGSLGVGNKLQDVFQRGWKIVQGPSLRYPNTVLITNGKVTKTINLRYVKVDKSLEKGVKELPVSPAKVNIKEQKTDNCSIELESDDDSIAVNDDNEDCENVVRRSTRRKIAVRRLSLGLGKSQSYEDKILK